MQKPLSADERNTLSAIIRTDARDHLASFIELASGWQWQRARHLDLICDVLEQVERGELRRVIITLPPRHGKSEVVSKHYPAWLLGRNPDWEVIISSYSAELAHDFSRVARTALSMHGDLWDTKIASDSAAVNRWGVEGHRGGLTATGVGGTITGRGARVFVIDDPFKGPEDSHSPTQRKRVVDWYRTVARTRLTPDGAMVVIHTRWHQDDLVGHLLAEEDAGGEEWTVINLPAIAETNDHLGREPGEPLWPERYPLEELRAIEKVLTAYWWNCEYQQRPGDPEGNMFKREYFRYFSTEGDLYVLNTPAGERRVPASQCITIQTCDVAGSTKSSADYFVVGTWVITPNRDLLLTDIMRTRIEGPDHLDYLTNAYVRWNPLVQGIESNGIGRTTYQTMLRTGLPILELDADKDKALRAIPIATRYKAGTVYHRAHAPWLGAYEEELAGFPNGANDDQVDVAAYAAIILAQLEELQALPPEQVVTYDEHVTISPV